MSESNKQTILIADDNPNNLKVLNEALVRFGYKVHIAQDGLGAVESAKAEAPDLIILDIHMPVMDGYEACRILKENPTTKEVPVIFISALNEQFNKVKAFELGAVDYLTKPIQIDETKARVEVHLGLMAKRQELEEFNQLMLEREARVIELKKEVNALAAELGRDAPYPEDWEQD